MKDKQRILIYFGADSRIEWGRSFQMAKAFKSLGHKVFYLDLPYPFIYNGIHTSSLKFEPFIIFRPGFCLPYIKYPSLRKINSFIINLQLKNCKILEKFKPSVIYVYSLYDPKILFYLQERLRPKKIVYDIADDRVALAEAYAGKKISKIINQFEIDVSSICNLLLSITENLKQKKSHLHEKIIVIPNGIDADMFNLSANYIMPSEYASIKGKKILYIGTIESWVDLDLIKACANRYPEYSFIFVGKNQINIDIIKNLSNLFFIGLKPFKQIPAYIYYSDICIIPFIRNNVTIGCDPLKLLQYISMGKYVLSTDFCAEKTYPEFVTYAKTNSDFIDLINVVMQKKENEIRKKIRQEIIKMNSWNALACKALLNL